jgi:hypothetical protein
MMRSLLCFLALINHGQRAARAKGCCERRAEIKMERLDRGRMHKKRDAYADAVLWDSVQNGNDNLS